MTFPNSPRVIYAENPLVEVVCQLKFPPILKIESELPAQFQERIRGKYPMMQENAPDQLPLPPAIAKVMSQSIPGFVQGRTYSFISADEQWRVALTREFLALSTVHYRQWEQFRASLQEALDALIESYQPSFFVRIGLRYRDVIRKSTPGLENLSWSRLIRPHVLGPLSEPKLSRAIEHSANDVLIALDNNNGRVRILHGLIRETNDNEPSYSIDSDFYYEGRTVTADVFKYLDSFNREAGNLFRWCITPVLHKHLGASKIR